jgi:hypothetical protein
MRHHRRFTTDSELEAIALGLLDRTLPKSEWTHAGHFAAALWIIATRPDIVPERDLPAVIRAYNLATGGENTDHAGYHETITQASLRACRAFAMNRPPEWLHETCNALLASPLGDTDWLLAYWSRGTLFSVAARRGWVAPDLGELPF